MSKPYPYYLDVPFSAWAYAPIWKAKYRAVPLSDNKYEYRYYIEYKVWGFWWRKIHAKGAYSPLVVITLDKAMELVHVFTETKEFNPRKVVTNQPLVA